MCKAWKSKCCYFTKCWNKYNLSIVWNGTAHHLVFFFITHCHIKRNEFWVKLNELLCWCTHTHVSNSCIYFRVSRVTWTLPFIITCNFYWSWVFSSDPFFPFPLNEEEQWMLLILSTMVCNFVAIFLCLNFHFNT